MRKLLLSSIATVLTATPVIADGNIVETPNDKLSSVAMDKNEGCKVGPMAQFGRYIGDWDIEDTRLSQDGKEWTSGAGARWNFTCVGNGTAIQDFWMPNDGGFGTNLRMYNKDTGSWDIAWTNAAVPAMAHIGAKQDEAGNIVMHQITPKSKPPRRITFFPPTKDGWHWKLDMSFDGEKTWVTVYKIKATRR